MDIVRVGGEIRVNTATDGNQNSAQVATLSDGGFVVIWLDPSAGVGGAGGDTSGVAVKAQVFTAAGVAVGSEILVNTATANGQNEAQVAALPGGGFVVTWTDYSLGVGGATGDTSVSAIKAQVFAAGGAPAGAEILVNTATESGQYSPQVAALSDGGFAVTWHDNSHGTGGAGGDTSFYAVKAQVFTAAGAAAGGELLVNTATRDEQTFAQITGLSGGGFVVAWRDLSQGVGGAGGDTSLLAVKAQVFTAAGTPVGSEILVNTATRNSQEDAKITALSGGGFAVTWGDSSAGVGGTGGDTSNTAVKAQVFTAAGLPVGAEILVNTATTGIQIQQQITALSGGGFAVAWRDDSRGVGGAGGDTSGAAVKAQVFTAAGAPVGSEILVNTATASFQSLPVLSALPNGGFAVAWQDASVGVGGAGGDTSFNAVKAQAFTATGTRIGGEILVNTATFNSQTAQRIATLPDGQFVVVWQDSSLGVGGAEGDASGSAIKAQLFALNDPAPTLAGAGGTTAFVEGANVASTPVAVAGGLTVADDGATLASATVSVTGGFQAGQDVLAFANASGMGNIAGSYNATSGVLTLTSAGASATLAEWQAALRSVTYVNSSDAPAVASRTISFVVNDGTSNSTAATQTVSVAAANDLAVVGGGGGSSAYTVGGSPVAVATSVTVADPDGETTTGAWVTITDGYRLGEDELRFAPTAQTGNITGWFDADVGSMALTAGSGGATTAQMQAAVRAVTYVNTAASPDLSTRTVVVQVHDGDGFSNTVTGTVTLSAAANAAPAGADATLTLAEDGSRALAASDFGFSDGDGGSLAAVKIATLPAAGTLRLDGVAVTAGQSVSAADLAAGKLVFTPAANANGAGYASLTFQVQDNGGVENGGVDTDASANTLTFNVTAVNDAPAGTDGVAFAYEDEPLTLTTGDFGFTDPDGHSLAAVNIVTLPTAGTLSLDGVAVTAGQSVAAADIAAGKLVFTPAADASGAGYASLTFRVRDAGGTANGGVDTDASANTLTFDVEPVNDPAVLGAGAGAAGFTVGGDPVAVAAGFTITDVEDRIERASIRISGNYQAGLDRLVFTPTAETGDITASIDADVYTLFLTAGPGGATAAQMQAAIRAVTYENTSASPDLSTRTVSIRVNDGDGFSSPVTRTVTLSTAANEAPSGADATLTLAEDGSRALAASDFGFSDGDGGSLAAVKIATLPTAGMLRLDGVAVTAGQSVSAADLAAGKLVFTPAANANGAGYASLTFQVQDNGGTTNGGVDTDASANTLTFNVTSVNDAPSGADATLALAEDGVRVLAASDFGFSDGDGGSLAAVKIASLPTAGTLRLDDVAVTAGQSVSAADLAAGKLVFAPAANASGVGYASLTFQVQDGGGTANGGVDTDASANTLTFDVAAAPPPPPPPPPPPDPSVVVDGVPVTIVTAPGAGGGAATQTVTVPVVTSNRPDTVGAANVADIVLVTHGGGPVLSVQAPAGYGLTANGPSAAQTAGTAQGELTRAIQAHTPAGSADQTVLTGGGGGFLGGLPATTPLLVQTITPTGGGAAAEPLVINGAPAEAGESVTALVIDARDLTAGSTVQLNNVEFAAVIGTVTVTGGAGSQTVWGDGASQHIFLGADDDVLHGGGGMDTVASAAGNDRLFGDDGADSVSGGVGDDFVHGNAGADTVAGGEGNDAAYGGKDDDRVSGDAGSDLVWGDLGNDFLHGNAGADTVDGGLGNDSVHGGQGDDYVAGGEGDDVVLGDLGDDFVQGGVGADRVLGGLGNDIVHGGQGDDAVSGDEGDDWLSGDRGNDTLTGGLGADRFHAYAQTGKDVVLDFSFAEGDRVVVDIGDAYTVSQGADGVVIAFSAEHQMLLRGVQLSALAEGWIVGG